MPTNSGAVSRFQRIKLSPSEPITGATINARKPSRLGSRNRYASIWRFGFQPRRVFVIRAGWRSACVAIVYLDKRYLILLVLGFPRSARKTQHRYSWRTMLPFVLSAYEISASLCSLWQDLSRSKYEIARSQADIQTRR